MASVQWQRHDDERPVVSGDLWRGVRFALPASLAAWYGVWKVVGWLT